MAAGAGSGERRRQVQAARVADEGHVGPRGQRFLEGGIGAHPVFALDVLAGFDLEAGVERARETPGAPGDDFDAVAAQRTKVAQVALAHAAQTDEERLHASTAAARSTNARLRRARSTSPPDSPRAA